MFDSWSRLVVHVAMDNTVVIEDISESFLWLSPKIKTFIHIILPTSDLYLFNNTSLLR